MTSHEWQQRIVDLESEIRGKEARLAMLPHAKGEAISEPKKLTALEQEESAIPALIEQLKRRVPILARELEDAQKTEAVVRYGEIEQQGAEAAALVSASTIGIRKAMQELLDRIAEAHNDWQVHGLLTAELEFLRIRFSLPPIQIPVAHRVTPEQEHAFINQYRLLFRQHAVTAQTWNRALTNWQAAQRHQEMQQRATEDKELVTGPRRQPLWSHRYAGSQ